VACLPPVGCLPIQITSRLKIRRTCLDDQNSVAMSYNNKLLNLIPRIQRSLQGSQILCADLYTPIIQLLDNSQHYGKQIEDPFASRFNTCMFTIEFLESACNAH